MPSRDPKSRKNQPLADRVYWYQLHVFQICVWIFCTLPCLALVIYFFPELADFFAMGPQRSSMVVIKSVIILVPIVLLFMSLLYLAFLLAAVFNVLVVRLLIRELRMPEAREMILQFYSDPRWLKQDRGTRNFPWWIPLWGGMEKNKRLNRLCHRTTNWIIPIIYS